MPYRITWREVVALAGAAAIGLMGWAAIWLCFCFGSNH